MLKQRACHVFSYYRYIHKILLNVDMSQGEAMDWMKMEPFVQKVMAVPDAKLNNWLVANFVQYDEVMEFRHV